MTMLDPRRDAARRLRAYHELLDAKRRCPLLVLALALLGWCIWHIFV